MTGLLATTLLLLPGCVHRIVTINSDPPGALVYMNEEEVGRTPVSKEFVWYGNYDVVVRKDGYQTLKTQTYIGPPLWQIIPIDLFTELLPLTDERKLIYGLAPQPPLDPQAVLARGDELREELESSEHTKTKPTTKPATPTTQAIAK